MSYLDRILQPGEEVRHIGRISPIIYLRGAAFLVLCLAAFAGSALVTDDDYRPWLRYGGLGLFAIGFIDLISAWLRRLTTEIAVTDRRIVFKQGLIGRRTVEMNMDKVESVDVRQSIFGRIFDFGTILIRGVGAGLEPLEMIDAPITVRNNILAR